MGRVIFHDSEVFSSNTTIFTFLSDRIWQLDVLLLDYVESGGINFYEAESIVEEVEHVIQNYRAGEGVFILEIKLTLNLNAVNDPGLVDSTLDVNLDDFGGSFLVGCDQEMALHQMDFYVFVSIITTNPKIIGFVRVVVQDLDGLSLDGITLVQGAHEYLVESRRESKECFDGFNGGLEFEFSYL